MGLATHLGPQLNGTVKNPNPFIVTSNTVSPNYLIPSPTATGSNAGTYRNTGVGDATQYGSFQIGTGAFPTAQTGVTVPALSTAGTATTTFYPGFYDNGGFFQPMVLPAGSYINGIIFDITSAFTAGGTYGSTSSTTMAINAIGAPGTTYASATTIVNHTGSGASGASSWNTAQRNQVGSGTGLSVATGASAIGYMVYTGNTDTLIQCVITLTLGNGTGPLTLTNGAGYLSINYCVRNPDGSYYPQTAAYPIANPPTVTY